MSMSREPPSTQLSPPKTFSLLKPRKYRTVQTETNCPPACFSPSKLNDILQLIFSYFCKKTFINKPNTFDQIRHNVEVLTLNKFMLFCKEFGLTGHAALGMTESVATFKKCSKNRQEMEFHEFQAALVKLGELCFKEDDDSFKSLLKFMKVDNETSFKNQMRRVKISIPETLLSPKHIRTFKIHSHCGKFPKDIIKQLELRKEQKLKKSPVSQKTQRSRDRSFSNISQETKYSQIHRLRLTRNKLELNSVISEARQQIDFQSYPNYSHSNARMGEACLSSLIEEENDEMLEELERRERRFGDRHSHGNVLQERVSQLRLETNLERLGGNGMGRRY